MTINKSLLKGFFLLGAGLLLGACTRPVHVNVVGEPTDINAPLELKGQQFSLVAPPPNFITTGNLSPGERPTPVAYELTTRGPTASVDACKASIYNGIGQAVPATYTWSGTGYAYFTNNSFLILHSCGSGAIVTVTARFQLGTQQYEGSTTVTY